MSLVVLHFGLRNPDLTDERTQRALQAGMAGFFFFHGGYRLKILLQEVYGQQHADFVVAGGGHLLSDMGHATGTPSGSRGEHRPFLFVQRREWAAGSPVNSLSSLFHTPRPRFGFTPGEQAILVRALLNESDVEIAEALGLSLDAVKKIWRRTYDRVSAASPYLLERPGHADVTDHRGREKRRHLLEYLRSHLEELRP